MVSVEFNTPTKSSRPHHSIVFYPPPVNRDTVSTYPDNFYQRKRSRSPGTTFVFLIDPTVPTPPPPPGHCVHQQFTTQRPCQKRVKPLPRDHSKQPNHHGWLRVMLKHRCNRTKHPLRRVLIVVESVDTVEGGCEFPGDREIPDCNGQVSPDQKVPPGGLKPELDSLRVSVTPQRISSTPTQETHTQTVYGETHSTTVWPG